MFRVAASTASVEKLKSFIQGIRCFFEGQVCLIYLDSKTQELGEAELAKEFARAANNDVHAVGGLLKLCFPNCFTSSLTLS